MAERPINVFGDFEVAVQAQPTANRTINLPDSSGTLGIASAQPAGIAAGTQTGSTGTIVFSNSNNVSFGMSNSSVVTASVASSLTNVNVSAGTTSNNLSAVVFSNSNNFSFGLNGSTVTASYTTPVVSNAIQNVGSATASGTATSQFAAHDHVHAGLNTLSIIGNTSGTTTAGPGSIVFAGGPNITLSASTAAGGITVSVSGQAPGTTNATGILALSAGTTLQSTGTVQIANSNGLSFGMSSGLVIGTLTASADYVRSISAGTTNATGNQVVFSNSNGVSFGANGATVTGSVATSLTNINVSAGTTSNNLSAITFSNSNGITFGLNASTVTASFQKTLQSRFFWEPLGAQSSSAITVTQASIQYVFVPEDVSFSRIDFPMMFSFGSTTTSNTAAVAFTSGAIIYSRNGSTLNPIVGSTGNTTYSYASNSSNLSQIQGGRLVSFGLGTSLSAGEYFVYFQMSTATSSVGAATTNLGASASVIFGSNISSASNNFQDFGNNSTAVTSNVVPFMGAISSSVSNTTQSIQMSQVTCTGTANLRANYSVMFRNF